MSPDVYKQTPAFLSVSEGMSGDLISIFSHTQASYAQALQERLGRGYRHAEKLYSYWFRYGELREEAWVEPQASNLVSQMQRSTHFSMPEASCVQETEEGVTKFVLRLRDGWESESVIIPMHSGITLCLSSQVGCRMGCAFCETGKMGLVRPLTVEEIVSQLFYARFVLKSAVRNVVFMGMGEPLDNYETVLRAVKVLIDPAGLRVGARRLTVSTCGHVEGIRRLIQEDNPCVNLAVSLNAPTDALRKQLMPVAQRWDLATLREAMEQYCAVKKREILIGYVLLKDVNDSLEEAAALAHYLQGLHVRINLIPYNSQKKELFSPPEQGQIERFAALLRARGYPTLLRSTKGQHIEAACGQLGNQAKKRLAAHR